MNKIKPLELFELIDRNVGISLHLSDYLPKRYSFVVNGVYIWIDDSFGFRCTYAESVTDRKTKEVGFTSNEGKELYYLVSKEYEKQSNIMAEKKRMKNMKEFQKLVLARESIPE